MIIVLSLLIQYRKRFRKLILYPLMLFITVPWLAAFLQLYAYGLSLINMSTVGMAVVMFAFALKDMNVTVSRAHSMEIDYLKRQKKSMGHLFEQTATALVNAIDAKDKYTHGHSARVAEYSRKIAELGGKSEEECDEIFFSALLHDVGKIGIPDRIINKEGKLLPDEYEAIKNHPVIGANILSSISEYPYLSIGAHYHHERYDGKGYPIGLKGEDIPEIARIVAVADAYDAMTSKRSYRDAIPQAKVREEIIKGSGTQFDPNFASIMQHVIDLDTEYELSEREEGKKLTERNELECGEYRSSISDGVLVNENRLHISLRSTPCGEYMSEPSMPALLLFDSNDGRVYSDEKKKKDLHYYEYGEIWYDGRTVNSGVRDMQVSIRRQVQTDLGIEEKDHKKKSSKKKGYKEYTIDAVRYRDHAQIKIEDGGQTVEITIALPDSTRFLYLGLTGQNCRLSNVKIEKSEEAIGEGYIKRIAEEISYINVPAGDVPNLQIDGYRADATEGIPIRDGLKITFHSMSLPTATLIWHCPFISLFNSLDKKVFGEGYREFALIRIDGEYWESDSAAKNEMFITKSDDFKDWEDWKERNKEGIDCVFTFERKGNTITTVTENLGIHIRNITTITDDTQDIYATLTGDQVALTNIRIS
ncbi:MAG: HD-GYP domain-containing protein [Lachnospiraceae bacterium]|nr:HD-GYP domain-containing protein [Lachnospiraceae bacterium]